MIETVVIGVDPSLTATGIAHPGGVRTIRSEGHEGATLRQRCVRLHNLCLDVITAVYDAKPSGSDLLVAIETPVMRAQGRTDRVHDRSGLWWLIVDALDGEPGIDVVEVTPSQRMRYATGRGRADKDEVLAAVVRRYPDVEVSNNNEADALVLRAMGCDYLGTPIVAVPQTHRGALRTVRWPIAGADEGEQTA